MAEFTLQPILIISIRELQQKGIAGALVAADEEPIRPPRDQIRR
jgi:hypothetical protein